MANHIAAKSTVCLLALVLLLIGCSSAKTNFSFRDVQWDMTLDQTAKLEAGQEDSFLNRQYENSYSFSTEIYGYSCELLYRCTDSKSINAIGLVYLSLTPVQLNNIYEQLLQDYPPKEIRHTEEDKENGIMFYHTDSAIVSAYASDHGLIILFKQLSPVS